MTREKERGKKANSAKKTHTHTHIHTQREGEREREREGAGFARNASARRKRPRDTSRGEQSGTGQSADRCADRCVVKKRPHNTQYSLKEEKKTRLHSTTERDKMKEKKVFIYQTDPSVLTHKNKTTVKYLSNGREGGEKNQRVFRLSGGREGVSGNSKT